MRALTIITLLWCGLLLTGSAFSPPVATSTATATAADTNSSGTTDHHGHRANATTTIHIQLHTTTHATWTITSQFPVSTPAEQSAFRRLAAAYENGTLNTSTPTVIRRLAAAQATATARPMTIQNVSRTAYQTNQTGVLQLTFTWTNFTYMTDEGYLRLDDAFTQTGTTWLPRLTHQQTLTISAPPNYLVWSSPNQTVENGSLEYTGPHRFTPGEITVIYAAHASPSPTTTPTTPPSTPPHEGDIPLIAGLVSIVLLGGMGYLWYRRQSLTTRQATQSSATETPGPDQDTPTEMTRDSLPADTAMADDAETPAMEDDAEPLLSDTERIEQLLEAHGGRMKQSTIVEETDWSPAKVSQLLSTMEEHDEVQKLRIGRENLIALPDEEFHDL